MGDNKKRVIEDVGEGDKNKIPKIDEVQASQLELHQNFDPNMDPEKLKQLIANRIYSQKYKQKKAQYVAELEMQARSLQSKIGFLRSQIDSEENHKHSLLIERQTMKLQIALQAKDTILKEAEIEKIKAEINRESELLRVQVEALTKMLKFLHSKDIMKPLSNSNSVLSGLGDRTSTNFDQDIAQNGEDKKSIEGAK